MIPLAATDIHLGPIVALALSRYLSCSWKASLTPAPILTAFVEIYIGRGGRDGSISICTLEQQEGLMDTQTLHCRTVM